MILCPSGLFAKFTSLAHSPLGTVGLEHDYCPTEKDFLTIFHDDFWIYNRKITCQHL